MITIAATLTKPLLKAYRQITAHLTTTLSKTPSYIPAPVPIEALPLLDHLPADNHKGSTSQHPMVAISPHPGGRETGSVCHNDFLHVQPITTSTHLLPLTPDEADHNSCPDFDNNDPTDAYTPMYLHNCLFTDDGRLYDDP